MFRNVTTALAALTLIISVGCKKEEKKTANGTDTDTTGKTDPTTGKTPDTPPAKDPKQNPAMLNDMKNCPSAVKGTTTAVAKADKGVTVTVTGADDATVAEIRKRAMHLAKASAAKADEVKHTGEGTGGGLGKCPIVLAGTSVKAEDVDKGTKVTVTPSDATKLDSVLKMATERADSMNKRGGVAHGSGAGMKEGSREGGTHNLKHSGNKAGAHGSGTGGGGSKGTSKNPCNP